MKSGETSNEITNKHSNHTRTPEKRKGNLNAQISCNKAGTKRMKEVINKYGTDNFELYTEGLLDYAETLMKEGIKGIPDGEYTFKDFLDDDGIELGKPVPIRVKINIEGDKAIVDFEKTSVQVKGPLNLVFSGTLTTVFYCFKAIAGQSIFPNEGIFRAIKVKTPKNSIVNCFSRAPLEGRFVEARGLAVVSLGA